MKIGLIAMSGVRAQSEELNRVGLTLPGFVERRQVIASMPSLSLLTLAALTPPAIDVEYSEIKDLREQQVFPDNYDLVAITSFSAQILDAYRVADHYLAKGIPVVLGGLHVTVLPEEAKAHATSVIIGEGEPLWSTVVRDAERGQLQPFYRQKPGQWFDLADAPIPSYELLELDKYNRLTVQTSRGCPHRCEFCASSILLTPKYRVKPVERVLDEIHHIKTLWKHPFIEFADDNSFVIREHYKELLRALIPERIRWFTETDISVAEDEEMLELMRESGCQQILIGLESPRASGLDGVEQRRNWKLKRLPTYEAAIERIQSHGITVNGCFILGLDGHTPEIFDEVYKFVERTGLYEVQITVQTAFPGTPLYARLKAEERIIEDGRWDKCTLFDVNFVPTHMTPEELQKGLIDLGRRLYADEFRADRRRQFKEQLRGTRFASVTFA